MLQKIREKSQGVFAWVILILICVPFALWGIQNYLGGGKEVPIASVGDKDFYQQDLSRAYAQYAQNLAGMKFDEEIIKQQAFDKLIRDEVLLQHVQNEGLVVTDDAAKDFIKNLEYFQTDGKFDKKQYKALLGSQRISSTEFVNRIKKALVMEQYQKAITDSSFVTQADIDRFFAIQNQQRDVEVITVPLAKISEQPTDEEIEAYYRQHQDEFQTEERVAIQYVELALDALAKEIDASEEQLKAYYEEHKEQYTSKERRKISHILFASNGDAEQDAAALEKALQAREQLKDKDFAALAAELSDDKLTAKNGGDLGLFAAGVMEKAFEEAALMLQLGEVSEPVKTGYGYHLIKVTELTPGEIKSYQQVKAEIADAYKRSQAENRFLELGEVLTDVSFENPTGLTAVSDAVGVPVKSTGLFTRGGGDGIAAEEAIRNAAFSEDVLQGNNSEPVELGTDKLVVLRMSEHQPAATRALDEVKPMIVSALQTEQARKQTEEKAEAIKAALLEGRSVEDVAGQYQLTAKKISGLTRNGGELAWPINQAIFKAAKPEGEQATVIIAAGPDGSQSVVSIMKVTPGVMSDSDKQKQDLAENNLANALGQTTFNAVLSELESDTDISIRSEK